MATKQTKEPGALVESIFARQERIRQRKEFEEQLRAQSWKASEIRDLRQDILDRDDGSDTKGLLSLLNDCVSVAMREGRYEDDLTPTIQNLRRDKPDGWILTMPEVSLVYELGRMMDAEAFADKPPQYRPNPHQNAASGWTLSLLAEGRLASATKTLGRAVALDAIPSWARTVLRVSGHLDGGFSGSGSTPAEQRLAGAQARRWEAIEGALRSVIRAVQAGGPIPEWGEGATWIPFDSAEEWARNAAAYQAATEEVLKRVFRDRRAEVLATLNDAQRKALEAEARDPGSAEARQARAQADEARRAAGVPSDPRSVIHTYARGEL